MKKKNLLLILVLLSPLCCLAETTSSNKPTDTETWIAFLPVIIFIVILIISSFKLKAGTNSPGFLTEKDNLAKKDNNDPNPPQSTSRVVAFLTGLTALTIGTCLTTFFIYEYFIDPNKPADMSNLTTVIWGLGTGVLPYGFNKTASALKTNS